MNWTDKRGLCLRLVRTLADIPGGVPIRELADQPIVSSRFMYKLLTQLSEAGVIIIGYAQSPRRHGHKLVSLL